MFKPFSTGLKMKNNNNEKMNMHTPEKSKHFTESCAIDRKTAQAYIFRVELDNYSNVYRDIAILDIQTFKDFHDVIFDAFDRYDPHMFRFYINNLEIGISDSVNSADVKDAEETTIDSIELKKGDRFKYIFDFGDDWRHSIKLLDIISADNSTRYPAIIDTHGESPEQYPNYEDEDDDVVQISDWDSEVSDVETDCEYDDDRTDIVYHDRLLTEIRKQRPDWNGDTDSIFIDDMHTGNRTLFSVYLWEMQLENISFSSIRELFRGKSALILDSESPLGSAFQFEIDDAIISAVEAGDIATPKDNELIEIFSAMRRRPDGRAVSLLHDIVWHASVKFLLEHECSQTSFENFFLSLEHMVKRFRRGYSSQEYFECCMESFNEIDREEPDDDFDCEADFEESNEDCICPHCRAKMIKTEIPIQSEDSGQRKK